VRFFARPARIGLELSEVHCDRCGRICAVAVADGATPILAFGTFRARWGWGTPWDTRTWDAEICVQCAEAFAVWMGQLGGGVRVDDPQLYLSPQPPIT
jgi:hypothetical protein